MMLIDGQPGSMVSASDRGLHYGDGLFETMRLHKGRVWLLQRHLARLRRGCTQLALPWPGEPAIEEDLAQLLAGGKTEGVVRLVLTRGDGPRGYLPPSGATGRRITALHSLPPQGPAAMRVGICNTPLGYSPALSGLKHLGRLEQVLAAAEVATAGWDEGLMLNQAGLIIEATRHNLFFLRDGRWLTPPVAGCGVAGVMRALILETLAERGMPCGEAPLRYDELHEIDAMFLCNAVAGMRPVKRVVGHDLAHAGAVETLRLALVEAGVAWLG
jgi:4-amino-4-deoxychorismate lyase